jgi:hypothetical protein
MANPIRPIYIIIGLLIVLLIIATIAWSMMNSVHEYRIAALLLVGVIKAKSPLVGGALEYLVRTFIWF